MADFDFVCVDCGCNASTSDDRNWSVADASRCLCCANIALNVVEGLVEAVSAAQTEALCAPVGDREGNKTVDEFAESLLAIRRLTYDALLALPTNLRPEIYRGFP